jgi:site-specific recombinase XerD
LRGTAATVLYLNGMGIGHIRKLLGHSKLSSTTIYLRIHDAALKKELSTKHPRLKIKEEKNEN